MVAGNNGGPRTLCAPTTLVLARRLRIRDVPITNLAITNVEYLGPLPADVHRAEFVNTKRNAKPALPLLAVENWPPRGEHDDEAEGEAHRKEQDQQYQRENNVDGALHDDVTKRKCAMKSGDKVTTNGGIRGVIVSVKDDVVQLKVPPDNIKLEFVKSSIAAVTTPDE